MPRGWSESFKFVHQQRSLSSEAAALLGGQDVLSPVLPVELRYLDETLRMGALLDTGADYSLLPHEAAEILGISVNPELGSHMSTLGVGGEVPVNIAVLDFLIEGGEGNDFLVEEIPFQVPLTPSKPERPVLIGRHPFLSRFHVILKMGLTTDPTLGKWTVQEITRRQDARPIRRAQRARSRRRR